MIENTIKFLVCQIWSISEQEINTSSRRMHIKCARFQIAYLLREEGWGYDRIGDFLDRDHSSIVNSCRKHNIWMQNSKSDPIIRAYQQKYERIKSLLNPAKEENRANEIIHLANRLNILLSDVGKIQVLTPEAKEKISQLIQAGMQKAVATK